MPVGAIVTGMVALWPGSTTTGVTVSPPPTAICQRSPVPELIAGSKASVVAVRVVSTGSGEAAPLAPNGPTTSGAMSHSPAVTGLPVTPAATDAPWPETTSGSPVGAPMSNWIGSVPVVEAVPSMDVVSLGTR